MVKFTLNMQIELEVSEEFLESDEIDFKTAILDGGVRISGAKFQALDPDGEALEIDGVDEAELVDTFMEILNDKARAE